MTEDGIPALEPEGDDLVVLAKGDLRQTSDDLAVSGVTGAGVAELVALVTDILTQRSSSAGLATRERHRVALVRSLACIADALPLVVSGQASYDIAAEEIRAAIRAVQSLVGAVDVEHLLDEIFLSFCVGK